MSSVLRGARPGLTLLSPGSLAPAQREQWTRLCESDARSDAGNPFFTPEVLGSASAHLPDAAGVRLAVVSGQDGVWRLAVPVTAPRPVWRMPVPAVHTWLTSQSFLGNPAGSGDADRAAWRSLLQGLGENGARWWVSELIDTAVADSIEAAAGELGLPTSRVREESRAATWRRPEPDYLTSTLSGKKRKELRRVRRRLAEAAGSAETVDLACVDTESCHRAIEDFLTLEAAGWKGRRGGAMLADPAEAEFFRSACRDLAARGALQILALRASDGRPMAMLVIIGHGATSATWKIAYDESWAEWSPGTQLLLDSFEVFHDSRSQGSRRLDSCAAAGHETAERLHPDRRDLTTLAVGVGGPAGRLATRALPAWLRGHERLRTFRTSAAQAAPAAPAATGSTTATPHGRER